MSRDISLFSGYDQKENRTTNYCLLILKVIYEENPKFLSEWLSNLLGESFSNKVGVRFRQQEHRESSVPDGLICQKPFSIYIETKNYDWFHDDQLRNHLAALDNDGPGAKALIALGNFEYVQEARFSDVERLCRDKYQGKISFTAATFEDFLDALPTTNVPKNLLDTITEFRAYLDEHDLLPTWKNRLDVVNCSGSLADVIETKVYMCPATGGPYAHKRSRYMGLYRNKHVEYIASIRAVVELQSDTQSNVAWQNVEAPRAELVDAAMAGYHSRADEYPMQVFLLDDLHPTDFIKDTKGGMMNSKLYFDISRLGCHDAEGLANKLAERTWSEYQRYQAANDTNNASSAH